MLLNDNLITLRAPEPGDLDMLYLLENDPATLLDGVATAPVSRHRLWEYIDSYEGNLAADRQLRLVIQTVADGTPVGAVDLYDYDPVNRRAYVGIAILPQYRSRGWGGRALSLLSNYCAEVHSMRQLAAVTRVDNSAAVAMFTRAGFIETGRFPGWIRHGMEWVAAVHLQRPL